MLGYEGISAEVREYKYQGTRGLVPGYKSISTRGISARVREYYCQGTRVLLSGYEGISAGVRGY